MAAGMKQGGRLPQAQTASGPRVGGTGSSRGDPEQAAGLLACTPVLHPRRRGVAAPLLGSLGCEAAGHAGWEVHCTEACRGGWDGRCDRRMRRAASVTHPTSRPVAGQARMQQRSAAQRMGSGGQPPLASNAGCSSRAPTPSTVGSASSAQPSAASTTCSCWGCFRLLPSLRARAQQPPASASSSGANWMRLPAAEAHGARGARHTLSGGSGRRRVGCPSSLNSSWRLGSGAAATAACCREGMCRLDGGRRAAGR